MAINADASKHKVITSKLEKRIKEEVKLWDKR
jgi:hypothetical protein